MKKRPEVTVVTKDPRLAEQIETALAGEVASVRVSNENEVLHRKPEANSLVFLDVRDIDSGATALVDWLNRAGDGLRVLVVAKDKSANSVLASMRAGAADHLSFPLDPGEVAESVRRIADRTETGGARGRIIAVFSLKGGQGVTFLATNLVDHVHALTRETCLLADLNLYMGHALVSLDMQCGYTPFDLVRDMDRVDDNLLFSSLEQHQRGFHVLGVSEQITDASQITGDDVGEMLGLLRRYIRYTVLDLPHDFSAQTLSGLDAADRVLLVVQQDVPSLKSAQFALRVFAGLGYEDEKIVVVVNRHLHKNEIELQDVESALKRSVFATMCNDYRTSVAVYNKGQTVDMSARESRLNEDFARLAGLLTGLTPRLGRRRRWRDLLIAAWRKLP